MIFPAFLQNTLMLLHNCRHDFFHDVLVLLALVIVLIFISCPDPESHTILAHGIPNPIVFSNKQTARETKIPDRGVARNNNQLLDA